MVRFGINQQENVFALLELNGTIIFVQWLWSVEEGWFGTKIHGHANVHPIQYGMGIFVFQILVLQGECGIKLINHANVLTIKYGRMKHAFHLKLLVPMAKYGIQQFMHVVALMVPSSKLTAAILSHIVEVRRSTIPIIINVNALMA